jgi:hypothetical protein
MIYRYLFVVRAQFSMSTTPESFDICLWLEAVWNGESCWKCWEYPNRTRIVEENALDIKNLWFVFALDLERIHSRSHKRQETGHYSF